MYAVIAIRSPNFSFFAIIAVFFFPAEERECYGGIRRHRPGHGSGCSARLSPRIEDDLLGTPFSEGDGMVSCPSNILATVSTGALG
jgi:hypothetical protein